MNLQRTIGPLAFSLVVGSAGAAYADDSDVYIGTYLPQGVDRGYVAEALPAMRSAIEVCSREAIAAEGRADGMLVLRLYLGPDGSVPEVTVLQDGTGSATLGACVADGLRALQLAPAHVSGASITLPVTFL